MKKPQPILVADLFSPLNDELIVLLRSLTAEDWAKPTVCAGWTVKDVASHLLDTTLRRLSMQRDGYRPTGPHRDLSTPEKLAAFVNQLNAEWVQATKRLSPHLLIALLEGTGAELSKLFCALDPHASAPIGVSWAGEQSSPNWFDVAREYTEKWHHQQQLRDATGRPPLTSRRFLFPVLDTFMRALPHGFRDVKAPEETLWEVRLEGEAGGSWFLLRRGAGWELWLEAANASGEVSLPADTAWRLFTKGLSRDEAKSHVQLRGPQQLEDALMNMICIVG